MSLSNAQKSLLKRAQREAGLDDGEYRELLQSVAGVCSSTDERLGDRHLDKLLGLLEAIYWRGVDAGALQGVGKWNAVFRQRGFWAGRNTAEETSRDRYQKPGLAEEITALEERMNAVFHPRYCAAIYEKVTRGRRDARALYNYRAALQRTLAAKAKTHA